VQLFRFTLPYALHLEVLLSTEVEHEVEPRLSVIITHRVKRSAGCAEAAASAPPAAEETPRVLEGRADTGALHGATHFVG
jgi:hypothetical protein